MESYGQQLINSLIIKLFLEFLVMDYGMVPYLAKIFSEEFVQRWKLFFLRLKSRIGPTVGIVKSNDPFI